MGHTHLAYSSEHRSRCRSAQYPLPSISITNKTLGPFSGYLERDGLISQDLLVMCHKLFPNSFTLPKAMGRYIHGLGQKFAVPVDVRANRYSVSIIGRDYMDLFRIHPHNLGPWMQEFEKFKSMSSSPFLCPSLTECHRHQAAPDGSSSY